MAEGSALNRTFKHPPKAPKNQPEYREMTWRMSTTATVIINSQLLCGCHWPHTSPPNSQLQTGKGIMGPISYY